MQSLKPLPACIYLELLELEKQLVSCRFYRYFLYEYLILIVLILMVMTRASFFNYVNFLVVSWNDVIVARTLDRKSRFHILNLIGQ